MSSFISLDMGQKWPIPKSSETKKKMVIYRHGFKVFLFERTFVAAKETRKQCPVQQWTMHGGATITYPSTIPHVNTVIMTAFVWHTHEKYICTYQCMERWHWENAEPSQCQFWRTTGSSQKALWVRKLPTLQTGQVTSHSEKVHVKFFQVLFPLLDLFRYKKGQLKGEKMSLWAALKIWALPQTHSKLLSSGAIWIRLVIPCQNTFSHIVLHQPKRWLEIKQSWWSQMHTDKMNIPWTSGSLIATKAVT